MRRYTCNTYYFFTKKAFNHLSVVSIKHIGYVYFRTSVKKLLAKEKDPKQDIEQYLEELLEKVSSLSAVEWARILREDAKICREDATVTDYLLNSLTGKTVAETIDDETRSKIKDLVNELVDCAGQETFPNKDEIEKVRKHNIEKELIAKD